MVLSTRLCGQQPVQLWESFPAETELPTENFPNNNDLSSRLRGGRKTRGHLPVLNLPNRIGYVITLIYAHMYVITSVSA